MKIANGTNAKKKLLENYCGGKSDNPQNTKSEEYYLVLYKKLYFTTGSF